MVLSKSQAMRVVACRVCLRPMIKKVANGDTVLAMLKSYARLCWGYWILEELSYTERLLTIKAQLKVSRAVVFIAAESARPDSLSVEIRRAQRWSEDGDTPLPKPP